MLGWLWRAIVGRFSHCQHQWETVDIRNITDSINGRTERYQRYVLKCKKCGDVCKREIK